MGTEREGPKAGPQSAILLSPSRALGSTGERWLVEWAVLGRDGQ